MKILVTGFDPFGKEAINPSYEALKLLPDFIDGAKVIKLEVPTSFKKGPQTTIDAIEKHRPDYVLCLGQAGGRSQMTQSL